MSCKENINPKSKSKHYIPMERQVFLQILERYKHIIEQKKSDGATLKDKEVAWADVCANYNSSSLITQERTVQQLKKLWTNLKQGQREALTKERQALMVTGGGPPQVKIDIDPDIARIAPNLMQTAPVSFTSNMSDKEINDKREFVFDLISTNENIEESVVEVLDSDKEDYKDYINTSRNKTAILQESSISTKDDIPTTLCIRQEVQDIQKGESNILDNENVKQTPFLKRKKNIVSEGKSSNTEETLRIKRITRVIDQEEQLAYVKQKHEENMNNIKENHLKEIYHLELQHLRQMQAFEIKIKEAQLKAIELKKDNIC